MGLISLKSNTCRPMLSSKSPNVSPPCLMTVSNFQSPLWRSSFVLAFFSMFFCEKKFGWRKAPACPGLSWGTMGPRVVSRTGLPNMASGFVSNGMGSQDHIFVSRVLIVKIIVHGFDTVSFKFILLRTRILLDVDFASKSKFLDGWIFARTLQVSCTTPIMWQKLRYSVLRVFTYWP